MSHPDPPSSCPPIIARVAAERPELDEDLLQALYQHLVLIEGRQPTLDELQAYVDRVSCLDQNRLRQRFGLEAPKRSGRRAATRAPGRANDAGGRPGWTPELFAARYQAALERATPPYTCQAVADRIAPLFRTGGGARRSVA